MRHTNWKHKIYGLAATAAVTALVAGCGGKTEAPVGGNATPPPSDATTGGAKLDKVTIGYSPNIAQPQPLIGLENGEFAKAVAGVTFGGKTMQAGPAVIEALRAGVVDIGYSGVYPPLKAFAKDKDIVLLAGAAKGGTGLIVSKDSPIKSVKDLKDKAVGVNQLGSTVDAMVRYNLIEAGLAPDKDVRILPIEPAEQADALKKGEVAAVAAPAPWPSQIEINGNGRALLNSKTILDNGNYLSGTVFTTKKFADAHPDFIKQFVAAHKAITDNLNKDRTKGDAQVLALWSRMTKKTLKPEVAKAAFATIEFTNEADPKSLDRLADISTKAGTLKAKPDLTGFVYEVK